MPPPTSKTSFITALNLSDFDYRVLRRNQRVTKEYPSHASDLVHLMQSCEFTGSSGTWLHAQRLGRVEAEDSLARRLQRAIAMRDCFPKRQHQLTRAFRAEEHRRPPSRRGKRGTVKSRRADGMEAISNAGLLPTVFGGAVPNEHEM